MAGPINGIHYDWSRPVRSAIELIEELGANYRIGCALKYLCRAGRKHETNRTDDLCKALNYIYRELYGTWFYTGVPNDAGPVNSAVSGNVIFHDFIADRVKSDQT